MLGLYVHIPFCTRKCFYCDFVSVPYMEDLADNYLIALEKEAEKYKDARIDTIYIGGGTPSTLSIPQLKKTASVITDNFNVSSCKEITVELNPESTTKEKLKLLFDARVSRLSLGLQSIYDQSLTVLGRLHNYEKFKQTYYEAREAGFNNINIDLMYGIPNQTLSSWEKTLKEVLKLEPQHISLYPLTVEQNTPFYKKKVEPNTDLQAKMYDFSCSFLKENNFEHYEISNWAKEKKYSLHNKLYWRNKGYIGLGTSASSYYKRYRYKNNTNVIKYIENILNNKNIIIEKEYITDELYNKEKIMLGLRLSDGVDIKYFENSKDVLNKYVNENLLVVENNRVKFTQKALFVSNSILADFI
ncbi:MAG: radical SAM family heme chaperone HemW [Elusimicrobia bacterium]|nr:radical SAM family heme chaperone HemW [Elusimicrobiota bacterium]